MDAKKNAYWIAMGVLALGAAIFWALAVWQGKNVQVDAANRALKRQREELQKYAKIPDDEVADPEKGMPVPKIAEYWEQKKKDYETEKASIETRYRTRDNDFEVLPDRVKQKDGTLDYTEFITAFHKEVEELETRYKALCQDGATAKKVFAFQEPQPGQDAKMVIAQKQYYMARAIAEAAKDAKAREIVSIEWKEVSSGEVEKGAAAKSAAGRITCAVRIDMPAPQVPAFVSKLLRAKVVLDIRELRVEAVPFALPEYEPYKISWSGGPAPVGGGGGGPSALKGFPHDVYVGTQDLANPKTKNPPPELLEPPVGVHATLDALDFELPEAKKE